MTAILFTTILLYLNCGILFGIYVLLKGPGKMDPGAKNTGIGFKLIILPGLIVLWPFLLKKFLASTKKPAHD